VRAGIDVTDPEIDAAMGQMRANKGKSENRVAEIFLPVDRPDQADDAQRTAQRVVAQLRGGTPFAALVQQFSSGPSAATGGDLGWILPGTLDPALDAAIARLSVNQVSEPVRTQAGWHVLKLLAQRSVGTAANPAAVRLNMAQVLLPFPANSSPDEIERQKGVAQSIMSKAKSCADLRRACDRTKGCTTDSSDGVSLGELAQRSPGIAEAARTAPIGQPLGPYQAGNAIQIVAVCSREGDGGLPSRDAIQQNIYVGKLEAAAKRYMRDLRRNAIIDMRKDCRI
jgi:peptidyl-prolyl cis-trans isomerase SurA